MADEYVLAIDSAKRSFQVCARDRALTKSRCPLALTLRTQNPLSSLWNVTRSTYGQIMVEERFRPAGFAAPLGLKDMKLVSAAATEARVPMPVLSLVHDRLLATVAREGEDIDWSGIAKVVAGNAGG